MERFIGLLLFVAAIYVASTVATEGLDHAFGGLFASDRQTAAEEPVRSDPDGGDEVAALPKRLPITERVRIQVQGDVDDYSARIGAD